MGFSPQTPPCFAKSTRSMLALILAVSFGGTGAPADSRAGDEHGAAASSAAGDAQPPAPTGNFFSSLKQAFKQDLDREVVRGHFDVGTPPDAHRYYCLVDAKTGRGETNGVAGEPVLRKDGMTGIKAGAVSFYSCVTAEQQGVLVTSGYTLSPAIRDKVAQSPPPPQPPPAQQAPSALPARQAPAATPPAPAPREAKTSDVAPIAGALQSDIMGVYTRFIAGQNAHDREVVSDVLLDSKDFLWVQMGGNSLWGHREALDAFQEQWKGTWALDPQLNEARIAGVAPNVAVLITPLLFTQGDPGQKSSTVPVRWSGVFVKTSSGWHISSIFITPLKGWQAPNGS